MRKINLLLMACLFFSSCEKELLTEKAIITSNEELTTRSNFYCNGGNVCLPNVDIYGNDYSAEISWSGPSNNDHRLSLTCSSSNGYIYRSSEVEPNGTWFFDFPEASDSYKITCTISCEELRCRCSNSITYNKPAGDNPGSIGSNRDCFKEYLSYRAEVGGQNGRDLTLYLEPQDYELLENTEKYMPINAMEIYKQGRDAFGNLQKVGGGRIDSSTSPYEIKFTDLPTWPGEYYEVHLINTNCKYNEEHYMYFSYYGDSFGIINLLKFNFHPKVF